MRRVEPSSEQGLRAELAAKWRAFAYDLGERVGYVPDDFLRRADALDRGEPVEVANWELPRGTLPPGALSREPYWYVIESDGTIRPADDRAEAA